MLALLILFKIALTKDFFSFEKTQSKPASIALVLQNEDHTFHFAASKKEPLTKRIHYHLPFLIQKIKSIKEPIKYTSKNKEYFIFPFNKITVVENGEETCLGYYQRSYLKDDIFCQEFTCGDVCDLRNSIKRSSKVSFKGSIGELGVKSFIEKKLCTYNFDIGGEFLTSTVDEVDFINFFVENNDTKTRDD